MEIERTFQPGEVGPGSSVDGVVAIKRGSKRDVSY